MPAHLKARRLQKQLEVLEKDNVQDDPHANLTWHKAIPKFEDQLVGRGKPGKKKGFALEGKAAAKWGSRSPGGCARL